MNITPQEAANDGETIAHGVSDHIRMDQVNRRDSRLKQAERCWNLGRA